MRGMFCISTVQKMIIIKEQYVTSDQGPKRDHSKLKLLMLYSFPHLFCTLSPEVAS